MLLRGQRVLSPISFFYCNFQLFGRHCFLKRTHHYLVRDYFSYYANDQALSNYSDTEKECSAFKNSALYGFHRAFSFGFCERNPKFASSASTVHSESEVVSVIQNQLRVHNSCSKLEVDLAKFKFTLSEDLVLQILQRHRSEWKSAYLFFCWASKQENHAHGTQSYNVMLDILGKMKQFDLMEELVEKIPPAERRNVVNERTFSILLNRYAGGHKVQEAVDMFYRREEFGLKLDSIAFQTLLLSLCRYKHVDIAESLLLAKKNEFAPDIKSMNIILNGWCVLGNLHETKRFWNDIITSACKPNLFTYCIFINALTKAGKLGTAVKLFTSMWKKGCHPDVAICNCIIDALCFKRKMPVALKIFGEMNEKGCQPDVATYNCLIKHLCKIRRMDEAYKLLDEMEQRGCQPDDRTYNYLLKSMKEPEEVLQLHQKMEKAGCRITSDTYNLILNLFMSWNHEEGVQIAWSKMEKDGVGPDQRSYTIMVHGLCDKRKWLEALNYFKEMVSKGMIPEPRTHLLVKAIEMRGAKKAGLSDHFLTKDNLVRHFC